MHKILQLAGGMALAYGGFGFVAALRLRAHDLGIDERDIHCVQTATRVALNVMANQIAIRVHCRPGDEVITDRTAHIITSEGGGPAANASVMIRPLDGPKGVFTGEQVKAALRDPNSRYVARQRLVSIENTSARSARRSNP